MRYLLSILILLLFATAKGQHRFDSLQTEKVLLTLPFTKDQTTANENIIRAIHSVDKKFREIADTLYGFSTYPHTILQAIPIETNDSVYINPFSLGGRLHTTNIIFNNRDLNTKVDSIAKNFGRTERDKLYRYLEKYFNHFSVKEKKLKAQPVRIRYIRFPDNRFVEVGIDIYGAHFLWLIDRDEQWNVTKVERLWVY